MTFVNPNVSVIHVDAAGLKECTFKGREDSETIQQLTDKLTKSVTVYLFADDSYLKSKNKADLVYEMTEEIKSEVVEKEATWASFCSETSQISHETCLAVVCVLDAKVCRLAL